MPTGTKFNDAGGDEHQQSCQNDCDENYLDPSTGRTDRKNTLGEPFDVYYQTFGDPVGGYDLCHGLAKCGDCPKIKAHLGI